MPRREYTSTVRCAETGCGETTFYVYETRREEAEGFASRKRYPWKCIRHRKPEELLGVDNPRRELTFVVAMRPWEYYEQDKAEYERELARNRYTRRKPPREFWDKPFWLGEDGRWQSSLWGEGFRAIAEDLPVGTKLRLVVEVEVDDVRP